MASSSMHYNNSLNPAWRDAVLHTLVQDSWPADTSDEDANELTEAMGETAYELRQLAPDSGAYINEVIKSVSFLDRLSANQHHSVETLCPTGRRLCTARITLVCLPLSTSTIRTVYNGVRAALRATSGTSRMMASSASSVGRKRTLFQHHARLLQ